MSELNNIIEEYFEDWTYPNIAVEKQYKKVFRDAYEMAQPQWTPISEGLPKERIAVLFQFADGIETGHINADRVYTQHRSLTLDKILAWMKLPKPYEVKNETSV